jgi:tetratricopeptide (TPR) repeat protein
MTTRKDHDGDGGADAAGPTLADAQRPSGAALRMFVPGDLVASRYRIIRFIARGGMGEVYEVEDGELESHVALKTIRADLDDSPALLERFKSEITLARRVTHTNVCRLFDLGFHDTPRGRVTFLTMELLDGESLRQRIRRAGRFASAEALPLVQQMTAALAAAHSFGIVHRDFKSDNVMLVPSAGAPLRVVVTDFGMARSAESALSLTSGELKGTPAYMAPEQVSNGPIGPAVDVYALGVVLYEMMTATLPFSGDSAVAVAIKRLTSAPPPPRESTPSLEAGWERVILRCLERDPARRFADVGEVARALVAGDVAAPRRRGWLAAAATFLVLASALTVAGVRRHHAHAGAAVPAPRRSFAVLGLRNLGERADRAWLATALSELLAAEVAAENELRRVPTDSVNRLRRQLELPDGGGLGPEALNRVRATLDADYVLAGDYLATGDGQLRLDVTLQDSTSGETLAADSESGAESALLDLVSRAGARLRRRLGLSTLSRVDFELARAALPAQAATAQQYADGLEHLRRFDALGARELLEQATAADPRFPLAHAALSETYRSLGRQADAEREALLAFTHASSLGRAEQLQVEANLRVTKKEWPRAVEIYRALYEFYPGSLDYGLALATVQIDAGRGRAALTSVAQLRRDIAESGRDPRPELVEAQATELLGDSRGEDAAAQKAEQKARALDERELVGDALLYQSNAALTLGDRPRAAQTAAAAYQLFTELGNPLSVGQALRARGHVAWKTGQLVEARALLTQAAALFTRLGNGDRLSRTYNALAGVESDLNHHDEALRLYKAALPLMEQAANRAGLTSVHLNLGQQLAHAGKLDEAEAEEQAALALTRELGQRRIEAIALESLSGLYLDRGEPERALETARQGLAVATQIEDATTMAQTRSKVGQVLHALGRVDEAEAALRGGIAELQRLGEGYRVGNAQTHLARLLLDVGRLAEAEALAVSAVSLHEQAAVETAESGAVLAQALVAEGRTTAARAAVDRALAHGGGELLELQMAEGEVELAEGHAGAAVTRIERALAKAPPALGPRFDAELALAHAERAAGHARAADERRRHVAEEATRRGYLLVARRAASP